MLEYGNYKGFDKDEDCMGNEIVYDCMGEINVF